MTLHNTMSNKQEYYSKMTHELSSNIFNLNAFYIQCACQKTKFQYFPPLTQSRKPIKWGKHFMLVPFTVHTKF